MDASLCSSPLSGTSPVHRLTLQSQQKIADLARHYGISTDAVMAMLQAVVNGNGTMAQFNVPELGGGGQWMRGGMTMVGDMFNHGLKAKVDGLCSELARLVAQQPFLPASQDSGSATVANSHPGLFIANPPSGMWWPPDFGNPNGSGGQNNVRYAYFSDARRLAIQVDGAVTIYDTLDHRIGGVSQQQGVGGTLTLTSQHGTLDVTNLPVVSARGVSTRDGAPDSGPPIEPLAAGNPQEADIFTTIERLAELREKGILTEEEFAAKKSELLGRL
jgi:Short C-terminal domain